MPDGPPRSDDVTVNTAQSPAAAPDSLGERGSSRRQALKWLIRASYGAFGLAFAIPALALRTLTQQVQQVAAGDVLVFASGDRSGAPLDGNAIESGTAVQAFPEGKSDDSKNLIELVRIAEGSDGLVAYSAICTHLGCSVLPTLSEDGLIFCPCHASAFDPANDAAVVSGPAPRPLPSLPITVEGDGTIVAAGEFSGPVGPD